MLCGRFCVEEELRWSPLSGRLVLWEVWIHRTGFSEDRQVKQMTECCMLRPFSPTQTVGFSGAISIIVTHFVRTIFLCFSRWLKDKLSYNGEVIKRCLWKRRGRTLLNRKGVITRFFWHQPHFLHTQKHMTVVQTKTNCQLENHHCNNNVYRLFTFAWVFALHPCNFTVTVHGSKNSSLNKKSWIHTYQIRVCPEITHTKNIPRHSSASAFICIAAVSIMTKEQLCSFSPEFVVYLYISRLFRIYFYSV